MPTLDVLAPTTGTPADAPCTPDATGRATFHLQLPAGASALHVAVREGDDVRLRAEIAARGGEYVQFTVHTDPHGDWVVTAPGRTVFRLPVEERYAPAPPRLRPTSPALDLVLVIDATALVLADPPGGPSAEADPDTPDLDAPTLHNRLLDDPQAWPSAAAHLVDWVERLAAGLDTRTSVLSFGDHPPPFAAAANLRPSFVLHPSLEDRTFHALDPQRLQAELVALNACPGGDFIDALGDALAACRELPWRPDARRLVLVFGDSPGDSLEQPPPPGASVSCRPYDVELQAVLLHQDGIEIVTLYNPPAATSPTLELAANRPFLDFAQRQYARLASLPEWAFDTEAFEPEAAAEAVRRAPELLARRSSLGLWQGPSSDSDGGDPATS